MDDKFHVRVIVRINAECEESLYALASHLEDAFFLLAFGALVGGVVLLMTMSQ